MSNDFELAIERQDLTSLEPMVHRNFLDEFPALRQALGGGEVASWVAPVAAKLTRRLPVVPCIPAMDATSSFIRPPRHARCFYYSQGGLQAGKAVIAVKGSEPLAPDFEVMLQVLETMTNPEGGSHQRHLTEHFALFEVKVPGALSLQEAESESAIAARVQLRHLEAYGVPAHLPFPLLVLRLPDTVGDSLRAALEQRLSSRAFARISGLLSKGLGVYIYYYPSLPVRVSQLAGALPQGGYPNRLEALDQKVAPAEIIDGWVRQFVRLLYLGYLPAALGARGTGACCDPNNSVIDGGFVDLDSLIPISELERTGKSKLLDETLHTSVRVLGITVRTLLAKSRTAHEAQLPIDLPTHLTAQYVSSRFRHFLESEARPRLTLHPGIARYFEPELPFAVLIERLKDYYPPFELEDLFSPKG